MRKIAVIGAGKTGRGFIGRLLAENDQEILFIDKNPDLVNALQTAGRFSVHFFGQVRQPISIQKYQACLWEDADLSDIDLIFVSVGGTHLTEVGTALKKAFSTRNLLTDPVRIIVCENASHPSKTLKDAIGLEPLPVSESTVFCTTIENGDLDIASENYPYLQCDADALSGYDPQLKGIRPVSGFENLLTRKLYTYNAASCVIAYLGWIKGYTDYGEAANDPEILTLLDQNYASTNRVLCRKYGYTPEDQEEFALLSKKKFCDRTIVDTVSRNAREPQRKLKKAERIMGPLCLMEEMGEDSSVLILTAAAALLYRHEDDAAWAEICEHSTPAELLTTLCGLPENSSVKKRILEKVEFLQKYLKGGRKTNLK